jgi:dienelactone hydrolase
LLAPHQSSPSLHVCTPSEGGASELDLVVRPKTHRVDARSPRWRRNGRCFADPVILIAMRVLAAAVVGICAATTACGGAAPEPPNAATSSPAAAPGAPMADSEHDRDGSTEAATREIVGQLAHHDFAAAATHFDDTMQSALPPERLAQAWATVEAQVGAFVVIERIRSAQNGEFRTSFALCRFERGEKVVRVAYDSRGRVAGLFFVDSRPTPAWTPPPYGDSSLFAERDVRVGSAPGLPGTLAVPKTSAPVPGVVLVHGSGPQDADETIGQVKVFKDIAFGLASRGIAVLRYAKRTLVDPKGVVTVKEEVVDDVRAAVNVLAASPEVDPGRIVVLGHSFGGYLAPRIARDDARVAALVILSGNTRPIADLLVDQVRYLASLAPGAADASGALAEAMRFKAAVDDPGLTPDRPMPRLAGGARGAYFLDLRAYRPEQVAAGLACPMFIAMGGRDYQVGEADFDRWRHALGRSPRVTMKVYPSLNHALVAGAGPSTPAEYDRPGHVDAQLIDDLARWIAARGAAPNP